MGGGGTMWRLSRAARKRFEVCEFWTPCVANTVRPWRGSGSEGEKRVAAASACSMPTRTRAGPPTSERRCIEFARAVCCDMRRPIIVSLRFSTQARPIYYCTDLLPVETCPSHNSKSKLPRSSGFMANAVEAEDFSEAAATWRSEPLRRAWARRGCPAGQQQAPSGATLIERSRRRCTGIGRRLEDFEAAARSRGDARAAARELGQMKYAEKHSGADGYAAYMGTSSPASKKTQKTPPSSPRSATRPTRKARRRREGGPRHAEACGCARAAYGRRVGAGGL